MPKVGARALSFDIGAQDLTISLFHKGVYIYKYIYIYTNCPAGEPRHRACVFFFAEPVYRPFLNLSLSLLQEQWRLWYNVITELFFE